MRNNRGQISIFFSTAVVVMITIMAFIINIGLFVKAKINLQNAVDAAAYAGASVQARQLTNIGYLNWAMRNVYKEWMFKYYVLGGLSLEGVSGVALPGTACPGGPKTGGQLKNFTMGCYSRTNVGGAQGAQDNYNFPSVCIDFANTGQVGLCTRFLVPGLPRFTRQNVLGMDETTNAFIDSIVAEKSTDCSERTELNFLTANTWAYNVLTDVDTPNSIRDQAPQMAIEFMGAFPQAFELGARIRNLESEVNFPAQAGICGDVGAGVNCATSANALTTSHQERTLKAYTSAFRNLGNEDDNEMKNSFTLTELPPNVSNQNIDTGLSFLLIPQGSGGRQKSYLDLKLLTANYAPFYTAFATSQGNIRVNNQVIDSEGQCAVTKMGLPVPGYPMHFVKNPDFLTYYAVQGQARWIGLFNPFANDIVLTAYAAAKPFGARIGPQIFDVSDDRLIRQRSNRKSSPYISALLTNTFRDINNQAVAPGEYAPGFPVPINAGTDGDQFWMTGVGETIGGFIPDGNAVFFGVPNLVYEYPRRDPQSAQVYYSENPVQTIGYNNEGTSAPKAGLYNSDMFDFFASNLSGLGGTVTTPAIQDALRAVSAPTLYETHNFLVPTPETLNRELQTDSYGAITGNPVPLTSGNRSFQMWPNAELYGPLYDDNNPNMLFRGPADLRAVLQDYLQRQEPAILKYKSSMNLVAADIYVRNKSRATGQDTGLDAARVISDLPIQVYEGPIQGIKDAAPTCNSIAGKFIWFYTGNTELLSDASACPPNDNLPELLQSRWNSTNLRGGYTFDYVLETGEFRNNLFSAYRPGGFRFTNNEGTQSNPASSSGRQEVKLRNFYSVKFIPLKSVTTGGGAAYRPGETMLIYSEGASNSISNEAQRNSFRNPLNLSSLGIDIDH